MFDQLKELGTQHFGSEVAGEAFAEGFLKQANEMVKEAALGTSGNRWGPQGRDWGPLSVDTRDNPSVRGAISSSFIKGIGEESGKGIAQAGFGVLGSIINAAASKLDMLSLRSKFSKAMEQVSQVNKVVRDELQEDPMKVKSFADTIFKFAPHVACDPNMLAWALAGTIHGGGVDANTIKMLAEMENRILQNSSGGR